MVVRGEQTIATCGGTFLDGEQWGAYDGLMLLGVLKGQGVLALRLDDDGSPAGSSSGFPSSRAATAASAPSQQGTDGALYVTTDNGTETDQLLRVTPR